MHNIIRIECTSVAIDRVMASVVAASNYHGSTFQTAVLFFNPAFYGY
jgi:hypothetical protein